MFEGNPAGPAALLGIRRRRAEKSQIQKEISRLGDLKTLPHFEGEGRRLLP
jgi:hypothetical protein